MSNNLCLSTELQALLISSGETVGTVVVDANRERRIAHLSL